MINNFKEKIDEYLEEQNERGFSLLELVVAVGILLILSVGGLIAYRSLNDNAKTAQGHQIANDIYTSAVAARSFGEDANSMFGTMEDWGRKNGFNSFDSAIAPNHPNCPDEFFMYKSEVDSNGNPVANNIYSISIDKRDGNSNVMVTVISVTTSGYVLNYSKKEPGFYDGERGGGCRAAYEEYKNSQDNA